MARHAIHQSEAVLRIFSRRAHRRSRHPFAERPAVLCGAAEPVLRQSDSQYDLAHSEHRDRDRRARLHQRAFGQEPDPLRGLFARLPERLSGFRGQRGGDLHPVRLSQQQRPSEHHESDGLDLQALHRHREAHLRVRHRDWQSGFGQCAVWRQLQRFVIVASNPGFQSHDIPDQCRVQWLTERRPQQDRPQPRGGLSAGSDRTHALAAAGRRRALRPLRSELRQLQRERPHRAAAS